MSREEASIIFIIVFGTFLVSNGLDAKCVCCEKINDHCCMTPNKKDVCCPSEGLTEKVTWLGKMQCNKRQDSGCMAVVSTPSGDVRKPCVFPFIYKGLQHQTCVTATDGNFWCFTETKPGGVGIPKSWGQCGPECPRDSYDLKWKVEVVSDYSGRPPSELTLSKGEILTVTTKDSSSWWRGFNAAGKSGYISVEHIKIIKEYRYERLSQVALDEVNLIKTFGERGDVRLEECHKECDKDPRCLSIGVCPSDRCYLYAQYITKDIDQKPMFNCFTSYVSYSPSCEAYDGISHPTNPKVCCHHACGSYCGSSICNLGPGGNNACCEEKIAAENKPCGRYEGAPCVRDLSGADDVGPVPTPLPYHDANFTKLDGKTCLYPMHREIFDDLTRAKESCKKDRNCRGVWDFWCNGTYLQKCEIGKPYSDDFEFGSACVYDKKVSTRPEIELVGQGDFKWVSFQQYLLTQWKKYREQPYYCQFKTPGGYGRWMIACKPEVENVKRETKFLIRRTLEMIKGEIDELFIDEEFIRRCPDKEYLMTCDYYWQQAMDELKAQINDPGLKPALKAYCPNYLLIPKNLLIDSAQRKVLLSSNHTNSVIIPDRKTYSSQIMNTSEKSLKHLPEEVTVITVDMGQDMFNFAMDVARECLRKFKTEDEQGMAKYAVDKFYEEYGEHWVSIVGENYGFDVIHQENFAHFHMESKDFVIYKLHMHK